MARNTIKTVGAFSDDMQRVANNNFRDVSVASASLTKNANTDLSNVTGLVTDVLEPGTYTFRINLGTSAGASGGLKVALKQSVASMLTSIEYQAQAFAAAAVVATRGTTATDAASIVATTSAVVTAVITGSVVVAKAGTLQVQAAQNASNGTDTIVYLGSFMEFERVGN